ncbi:MAG: preprotein translocase subunit SecE [Mycobacterium sp.]
MSDERDDADAAADGGAADDAQGGRTAVVTRPQRPTGKRSRQRADDADSSGAVELTESDADDATGKKAKKAKKAKTARKPGEESTNPIVYVITYLRQVVAELRKVIWPNRKQMGSYTSVVLVFLVFMVTLIGLVDVGLAKLVLLVFG